MSLPFTKVPQKFISTRNQAKNDFILLIISYFSGHLFENLFSLNLSMIISCWKPWLAKKIVWFSAFMCRAKEKRGVIYCQSCSSFTEEHSLSVLDLQICLDQNDFSIMTLWVKLILNKKNFGGESLNTWHSKVGRGVRQSVTWSLFHFLRTYLHA